MIMLQRNEREREMTGGFLANLDHELSWHHRCEILTRCVTPRCDVTLTSDLVRSTALSCIITRNSPRQNPAEPLLDVGDADCWII